MPSAFEEKVWALAKKIPEGKVTTYSLLAKAVGNPKAARAVGNALNKNPFSPKVPCHRVINSSGFIGQFSKGIGTKIKLLELEGIIIDEHKKVALEKYLFYFK